MTNIVIGSIAVGLAALLWYFKRKGRVLTVSALIAGLAATPMLQGLIGGLLSGLDSAIAIGIPLALATFATGWLVLELKDKGTASATPWIALVTPALWIVAAGPFLLLVGLGENLLGGADQAVSAVQSASAPQSPGE